MFLARIVLYLWIIYLSGLASMTTGYPYTVTRVGEDVNMTMNPENASFVYSVWVNGSVSQKLLVVVPLSHRVVVLNNSRTSNTTRIRYTGEDSPSQAGQLRFTIYNVAVQDAGTYYCQRSNGQEVTGCRQAVVIAQKPATPTITGPASNVSGENVTLTCSSSSISLPPDHPPLTMTYIWRRNMTLLESADESPTGGDDLTITHVSRENHGDTYSCKAVEEGLESDWSHGHVLNVLYGPDQIHFNGTRSKLEVEEGKPVTVRCSADCNPTCTVTWWDTSRQVVITGHREAVLSIPAVDGSLSGQYTCHVNNSHGSASRNLTLKVFTRELTESGVVSIVPVVAAYSVLIVVIAFVIVALVFRKNRIKKECKVYRAGMADNEAQFQQDPSVLFVITQGQFIENQCSNTPQAMELPTPSPTQVQHATPTPTSTQPPRAIQNPTPTPTSTQPPRAIQNPTPTPTSTQPPRATPNPTPTPTSTQPPCATPNPTPTPPPPNRHAPSKTPPQPPPPPNRHAPSQTKLLLSDVYATVQKNQCRLFMNRAYAGAGPSSENAVLIDYAGPVAGEYNCGETNDDGLTYADPALELPTLIDGKPIMHRREEPAVYEEIDFALTPGPQLPDKMEEQVEEQEEEERRQCLWESK
ncbi:uncharacterized protein [Haliotis asinina]|uniref:uncharacterized protein n=1 Tax=Haliotis asinina TaxID=109174 RepID=UPI0035320A17